MARPKGKRMARAGAGPAKRRRKEEDLMPDADDADMFQVSQSFLQTPSHRCTENRTGRDDVLDVLYARYTM